MAIYHLAVKAISRTQGRSAVAAAAYRAGDRLVDERTGHEHDYRRRGGVESAELVLPSGSTWQPSRSEVWNMAEAAERQKNACVAREHEVALPSELSRDQQAALLREYAQGLADRHGCVVDVALHAPGREGDSRNWHAHVLCSTRVVDGNAFGAKCDREKAGRNRRADLEEERLIWEQTCNAHLERAGVDARIDRRTLDEQGIERAPTTHLGPVATGMERAGKGSDRGDINRAIAADNEKAAAIVVDLDKERRKRIALEQKAKRLEKYETIPLEELRAIRSQYVTPATFEGYVATSELVESAKHELRVAGEKALAARNDALRPAEAIKSETYHRDRWREQHPLRAKLHDWGMVKGGPLDDFKQKIEQHEAAQKAADARAAELRRIELEAKAKLEKVSTDSKMLAELRQKYDRANYRFAEVEPVLKRRELQAREIDKTLRKFRDAADLHARGKLPGVDPRTGAMLKSFGDAQRQGRGNEALAQVRGLLADPKQLDAMKKALDPLSKVLDRSAGRGR